MTWHWSYWKGLPARRGVVDVALLAMSILVATSFAWLFYVSRQTSDRNHAMILRDTALIAQIRAVAVAGSQADCRQEKALRAILAVIRDGPPMPLTPAEAASRRAVYDRLIAEVPLRGCILIHSHR